jgi:hypothetical protein
VAVGVALGGDLGALVPTEEVSDGTEVGGFQAVLPQPGVGVCRFHGNRLAIQAETGKASLRLCSEKSTAETQRAQSLG